MSNTYCLRQDLLKIGCTIALKYAKIFLFLKLLSSMPSDLIVILQVSLARRTILNYLFSSLYSFAT